MMYNINFTAEAREGLARLERNEPKAFAKAIRFIEDLKVHPKTGLGPPSSYSFSLFMSAMTSLISA
ncbi:MAG: hypothetical protein IJR02_08410 [Bacteroidaceae bacterium]|nr:hypothetical protein [Bacteroidaceae bacterium]